MKCESGTSINCEKIIKGQPKYIWDKGKSLRVCEKCFYKLQLEGKAKRYLENES